MSNPKADRTNVALTLFALLFILSGVLCYDYIIHTQIIVLDHTITDAVNQRMENVGVDLFKVVRLIFPGLLVLSMYLASATSLKSAYRKYRIFIVPLIACLLPFVYGYLPSYQAYNVYGMPLLFCAIILFSIAFSKSLHLQPKQSFDDQFSHPSNKTVNEAMSLTFDVTPDIPKSHD